MAILLVKTKIIKPINVCGYINLILVLLKCKLTLFQADNFTWEIKYAPVHNNCDIRFVY